MAVSWIYRLRNEQLEEKFQRHEIDAVGSLAVLRQRLVNFVRANPGLFNDKPEDIPEYKEDIDRTQDLEVMRAELDKLRNMAGKEKNHTNQFWLFAYLWNMKEITDGYRRMWA